MKVIQRYDLDSEEEPTDLGSWCKWAEVKALQKELEDVRSLVLAAVQLIPDDIQVGELSELRVEAREIFMGKDKKTIAQLQDRVAALESDLRNAQYAARSPGPGILGVYGVKGANDIRLLMPIVRLRRLQNEGIEVEVKLP